ncbi:hypothetical protein [Sphingobium sp. IP1]|uniref:hypothetical protein n=1 Tax=Sphingobium sp. IP1 TaxID=2021637 RepID=UPI00117BC419|nr:hypothetical protein [Sphingobium sp. IP1]
MNDIAETEGQTPREQSKARKSGNTKGNPRKRQNLFHSAAPNSIVMPDLIRHPAFFPHDRKEEAGPRLKAGVTKLNGCTVTHPLPTTAP